MKRLAFSAKINPLTEVAMLLHFVSLLDKRGLIRPVGRVNPSVKVDIDANHPILEARRVFVKVFLWHTTHVKNHHEGIEFLHAEVQERNAILKLKSVLCRRHQVAKIKSIMIELSKESLLPLLIPGSITIFQFPSPFVKLPRMV